MPLLNQSAIFVGVVVGFLNVCKYGSATRRGHNKKQIFSLPVICAIMAKITYASSPPPSRLNIIFDLEAA
ncbi:MAG: hypothetical protein ACLPSL_10995 [Smithella sp.]